MNQAKKQGGHSFELYTEALETESIAAVTLTTAIHRALEADEFLLQVQPHVRLKTGRIMGGEALIRWPQANGTNRLPSDFIPLAEDTGQIIEIDRWVLRHAISQKRRWESLFDEPRLLSVNLSSSALNNDEAFESLLEIILETPFERRGLILEVTETAILTDTSAALRRMQRLCDLGVQLALDDFGTGYSSLVYLANFPAKIIKLDWTFIRDVETSQRDAAVVRSILELADVLEYTVIAEGIETQGQQSFLADHGCLYGQGFLFYRPMDWHDFELLLLRQTEGGHNIEASDRLL